MNCNGSVTFGGTLFAAAVCDIKSDDGHSYHFHGYYGEIGTPNVGYGTAFSGDFPGLDHIEGSCWFEVAEGAGGPGFAQLTFWDSHGQIGTLLGQVFGGGFDVGIGGGSWNDEEWRFADAMGLLGAPVGKA